MITALNALLNHTHTTTNVDCLCGYKLTLVRWDDMDHKIKDGWNPPARWSAVVRNDDCFGQFLIHASTKAKLIEALETELYLFVDER